MRTSILIGLFVAVFAVGCGSSTAPPPTVPLGKGGFEPGMSPPAGPPPPPAPPKRGS